MLLHKNINLCLFTLEIRLIRSYAITLEFEVYGSFVLSMMRTRMYLTPFFPRKIPNFIRAQFFASIEDFDFEITDYFFVQLIDHQL